MQSVFAYDDYRAFLRHQAKRGALTRMAQAAHCQRSHLSRVLHASVHLTLEQAFGLTELWELGEAAGEYFLTLVEHARAAQPRYRRRLELKLARLKREQEDLGKRLRQPALLESAQAATYYSSWLWSALHMIVAIPDFQTSAAIARRLLLPEPLVERTLRSLLAMGLVTFTKNRWQLGSSALHLPKDSPLVGLHHQNWRQRAVLDALDPGSDGVHYSVVQSVSRADFPRVKAMLLELIDRYSAVAGPSAPEELVCFNCDLFRA